jgi:hypothetical protein
LAFALADFPLRVSLFELRGIAYFDGLHKTYSDELVIRLIFVLMIAISVEFGRVLLGKVKSLIYLFGLVLLKKNAIEFGLPLLVGGVFLFAYTPYYHLPLLSPLLFYGLALVNAGKYTFSDIRYLVAYEIVLDVFLSSILVFGLFWAVVLEFCISCTD